MNRMAKSYWVTIAFSGAVIPAGKKCARIIYGNSTHIFLFESLCSGKPWWSGHHVDDFIHFPHEMKY